MNEFLIAIGKLIKERFPALLVETDYIIEGEYSFIRVWDEHPTGRGAYFDGFVCTVYEDRVYALDGPIFFDIADPAFSPEIIIDRIGQITGK